MFKNKESFYHSSKWQNLRRMLLLEREKDGILYCSKCGGVLINKKDIIAHHKIELTDENVNNYNISLNPDNIELIHARCHNKTHGRFMSKYEKEVIFVWGCMCSGKSSYVNERATTNDLIVDIDRIYTAISNNEDYIKPDSIAPTVMQIRTQLYDLIKHRHGEWHKAFVISTVASELEKKRLKDMIGATKEVYIKSSKEECLKRAVNRPKYYIKLIEEWWEKHKPPTLKG